MDEFKAMAKVLAAIKAGENSAEFNLALVSERALGITEKQRDKAALLLYKNGYSRRRTYPVSSSGFLPIWSLRRGLCCMPRR